MGRSDVNVGKKGINESLINEIKKRLKSKETLRIRINNNLLKAGNDRKEIAIRIAELVRAELVEIRGHVFILKKSNRFETSE